MKRWLVILLVALLLAVLGITLHQNYLEVVGIVLLIFALAMFIWSWVRLSVELRPRSRRRIANRRKPVEEDEDGLRRSKTEILHSMIFRTSTTDLEE